MRDGFRRVGDTANTIKAWAVRMWPQVNLGIVRRVPFLDSGRTALKDDPLALIEQVIVLPCWVRRRGFLHGVRDLEVQPAFATAVHVPAGFEDGRRGRKSLIRGGECIAARPRWVGMMGKKRNSDSMIGCGLRGPLMRPCRTVSSLAKRRSWMSAER